MFKYNKQLKNSHSKRSVDFDPDAFDARRAAGVLGDLIITNSALPLARIF